jgi:hypothetical protein
MQVWWSRLQGSAIPYRLYALSNLASLLALAAYPTLIEPQLTLRVQRIVFAAGFAAFALVSAWLTLKTRAAASIATDAPADADAPVTPLFHRLLWVLLPMGAAMQLSAITSYLTANVAAIPLLWVLPLMVYLLTLILAFQFRVVLPWAIIARVMVVMLGALAYSLSKTSVGWPLWLTILFFLIELFLQLFCHSAAWNVASTFIGSHAFYFSSRQVGRSVSLIGIASPMLFH